MEVKVYIEEEKGSLVSQPEEWCEKVQELGLAGQKKFLPGSAEEKVTTNLVPFMRMTAEMLKVYGNVLPDHTPANDYAEEPIPMKALSAIALAEKEGWFKGTSDKLEIWHAFGKPDPIAVGMVYQKSGANHYYLLAQWGPEIISFEAMQEKYLASYVKKVQLAASKAAAHFRAMAESTDLCMLRAMKAVKGGNDYQIVQFDSGDIDG